MVSLKEIIDRIKQVTGFSQTRIAKDVFGISLENLSNRIRRNSVDVNVLVRWAAEVNCDLNWLLTGEGLPNTKSADSVSCICETSGDQVPHGASFQDKRYALDLETHLAELERLSPEAYKKIGTYIKGVLDGIRVGRQSFGDRRQGERRTKDAPDKIPNGKDRRGGCDRRKGAA